MPKYINDFIIAFQSLNKTPTCISSVSAFVKNCASYLFNERWNIFKPSHFYTYIYILNIYTNNLFFKLFLKPDSLNHKKKGDFCHYIFSLYFNINLKKKIYFYLDSESN